MTNKDYLIKFFQLVHLLLQMYIYSFLNHIVVGNVNQLIMYFHNSVGISFVYKKRPIEPHHFLLIFIQKYYQNYYFCLVFTQVSLNINNEQLIIINKFNLNQVQ